MIYSIVKFTPFYVRNHLKLKSDRDRRQMSNIIIKQIQDADQGIVVACRTLFRKQMLSNINSEIRSQLKQHKKTTIGLVLNQYSLSRQN